MSNILSLGIKNDHSKHQMRKHVPFIVNELFTFRKCELSFRFSNYFQTFTAFYTIKINTSMERSFVRLDYSGLGPLCSIYMCKHVVSSRLLILQ